MTIRKAVIPAAGLGTRFLPATKSTPKEMLPIVDKPAIQYVVEEAVRAGLDDVLMITGRSKRSLDDHFDAVPELEAILEAKGDEVRLAQVRRSTELADVHFVRQGQPKGLGHPALFAVLEKTEPGRAGEIQLTDALATLATMPAEAGGGVYGVIFRGRRYDTGDPLDYIKAVIQIAAERPDLGPDLRGWLVAYVDSWE